MADEQMIVDPQSGLKMTQNQIDQLGSDQSQLVSSTGDPEALNYLKQMGDRPINNLTRKQKDIAINGYKDYIIANAQSKAPEGQALPADFELPSYSEIYAPIFAEQFPPIKSVDDLTANGLLDESGPTEKGQLLIDLKNIGGLNNDYTLNITGKALLSNAEESVKPENLPVFMERKRLGLDEQEDKSWSASWDDFKKVLGSTAETFAAMFPSNAIPMPSGTPIPMGVYVPTDKKLQEDTLQNKRQS